MNSQISELVFVLDRSGSMAGLERDTIGGFNSMVQKWKDNGKDGGSQVFINTVLFDHEYTVLHDRVKIEDVQPMTEKEYWARGSTALYDAVGRAIQHVDHIHRYIREEDVPGQVVVIITTDGYENASTEFSGRQIADLIGRKKEQGWEFIFLGAEIDAQDIASDMNISRANAFSLKKNSASVGCMFGALASHLASPCTFSAADFSRDLDSALMDEDENRRNRTRAKKNAGRKGAK